VSATGANADPAELARFASLAARWWDPEGPLKPLHALNPARLVFIRERVPLAGIDACDVGCGGGLLAEALAAEGARVLGIDLARETLEVARLHALERGLPIEYREVAAERLAEERPQAFGLVSCMELIEHVPDPASLIRALAALLAPGGELFLSTIARTPRAFLHAILVGEHLLRLLPVGTHRYERFVRPSELCAWLRAAGLEVVSLSGIEWRPWWPEARLVPDLSVNYLVHARKKR
jgi:2-polyprenyl-6-hydroxyphenyl methylase/3-demethylubiquinone-9 3-methyltransferase